MNPHARRHQQQQLLRDERVETDPLPDDWCVVCDGKGGWHVVVPYGSEWEVCVFCDNGPDDPENTP